MHHIINKKPMVTLTGKRLVRSTTTSSTVKKLVVVTSSYPLKYEGLIAYN